MVIMEQIKMCKSKNLSVEEAYDLFIRKCRIKNLAEASITSYEDKVKPFVEYCPGLIANVTSETVDDFTAYLKTEHNVNDVSVSSYLRSVRAFLYYCMDCNYMESFKIHLPKVQKEIKETYTMDELERLLAKPDVNTCSFTEYKVWVFENYLLATGNRLSTALSIRIKEVDFDNGMLMLCKTKNRRQQMIPLSNSLSEILREYLDIRGGEPDDYLFCNNYGQQASNRTFQTLVYRYNVKHNVNKTSCHTFRHTFAKQWILAGGDVFRLQKILGHSDLTVTKEYVNMFGQDLQLDFEKFNPLDNMRAKPQQIRMS